jgi:hypothetical protein
VWLPLALLTQMPSDQVEALLAHELAHVARLDWCWNALQCAIESVLFHHPGMWWLSRRIREEREHACDDLAVAVCGDPVVLAEALAALQRRRRTFAIPSLALAAEGGSLMKRVAHLLSVAPARPSLRWPAALLFLLCSGSLLAMQVMPPASLLVNLRSDVSSQGELTPGNYREYVASYLGDKTRRYRISMDAAGHVDEVYAEAARRGCARRVDVGVANGRRRRASRPSRGLAATCAPVRRGWRVVVAFHHGCPISIPSISFWRKPAPFLGFRQRARYVAGLLGEELWASRGANVPSGHHWRLR